MLVDVAPRVTEVGGDEQQQRALGLVEVGDDGPHHLERVRRHNHQAGGGGDILQTLFIQKMEDGFQGVLHADGADGGVLVHLPLLHMQRVGETEL